MKDAASFRATMREKGFVLTPSGWVKASAFVPKPLSAPLYIFAPKNSAEDKPRRLEGTYTLPYPPVLNHYYIHTRRGVFLSPKGRAYKETVKNNLWFMSAEPTKERVALTIRAFRPAKRGDVDSILKCLLDSLEGVLYQNDRQIEELHVYRHDDKLNPRVEVSISLPNKNAK